ncbi:MAG: CDP-glucose 4,6-dehydratase [Candidatus Methanomethylophilaceae archaeon]
MNLFSIFKGKTVIVTGHTGFKGSWLCLWLVLLGAKVHGFSLPPNTEPNHYTASRISELLKSEKLGDIRDRNTLKDYIHSVQPDCIFHLAAQPLVRRSYAEPVETFDTNVMGSIYLMDAVRSLGNPCSVVMITSDKCYENVGKAEGYVETDPMGGHDPYSASKGCAELAVASYRRSFFPPADIAKHGVSLASVRAGNVVGGGDWAEDRIIPDAVRAVTAGRPLEIRSPNAVRPWQHVLEPLSGYLLLAAKMMQTGSALYADGWNFGPKVNSPPVTVAEIIDTFYKVWGKGKAQYDTETKHLHEAAFLTLSSEKAETVLGWKQQWDVTQTMKTTAEWYKNYYAGADARELSLSDITSYTKYQEY